MLIIIRNIQPNFHSKSFSENNGTSISCSNSQYSNEPTIAASHPFVEFPSAVLLFLFCFTVELYLFLFVLNVKLYRYIYIFIMKNCKQKHDMYYVSHGSPYICIYYSTNNFSSIKFLTINWCDICLLKYIQWKCTIRHITAGQNRSIAIYSLTTDGLLLRGLLQIQ
jgi:hypothetical protein